MDSRLMQVERDVAFAKLGAATERRRLAPLIGRLIGTVIVLLVVLFLSLFDRRVTVDESDGARQKQEPPSESGKLSKGGGVGAVGDRGPDSWTITPQA